MHPRPGEIAAATMMEIRRAILWALDFPPPSE
jgi:hypothetical protein